MVRPSRSSDLESIAKLFLLGFNQSITHFVGVPTEGLTQAIQDVFYGLWDYGPQGILVAEAEGAVVGYIVAIPRMSGLWKHILLRGHWWKWLNRWLRAHYGLSYRHVMKLGRNKLGFALAQARLSSKPPNETVKTHHMGQILSIAVRGDFQGQGIATALLGQALSYLTKAGADTVKLEVRPDNSPAIHLYKRAGFNHISTTTDSQGTWLVMLRKS